LLLVVATTNALFQKSRQRKDCALDAEKRDLSPIVFVYLLQIAHIGASKTSPLANYVEESLMCHWPALTVPHSLPIDCGHTALASRRKGFLMSEKVCLKKIRIDGGTQPRAAIYDNVINDYANALLEGTILPPVVVFFDGDDYWLGDGFHRYHANKKAKFSEIEADVRNGTRRDAILYSVGANVDHGLRRTNEDKRRAVMTLLTNDLVRLGDDGGARVVLGAFDVDPASNKEAQKYVKAKKFYSIEDDGLKQEWHGRIWLNPPYANMEEFVEKLVKEIDAGRVTSAIMLTHNYTDTKWFHLAVSRCSAICFTSGRVKFWNPNGKVAQPTQGQCFFYFGSNPEKFAEIFDEFGRIVYPAPIGAELEAAA
jgi:phage N-6-adenine-methyltransferase